MITSLLLFNNLSFTKDLKVKEELNVKRLNNGDPIISRHLFEQINANKFESTNINGPSLIKVPQWLKDEGRIIDKDANYYLYFAHHRGGYIRLAWANKIEGPYHLFDKRQTTGKRGVFDLGKSNKLFLTEQAYLVNHVASPEVLIDDQRRMIKLFFHAPYVSGNKKGGKTFMAISEDGLDFNQIATDPTHYLGIHPIPLEGTYLRIFNFNEQIFAISRGGHLFRAKNKPEMYNSMIDSWEMRPTPIIPYNKKSPYMRHAAVLLCSNELWIFYSRIGDKPERILLSRVKVDTDWLRWKASLPPQEVLRPEMKWEGVDYKIKSSKKGVSVKEQALRDPFIYVEDGNFYMLYSGSGEEAIGLAQLELSDCKL